MTRICIAWLPLAVACGSAQSPEAETKTEEKHEPTLFDDERSGGHRASAPDMGDDDDDGISIEGLKGQLSSYDISQGIDPHSTALAVCFQSESGKNAYLGGSVQLGFTVALDGSVKSVRVTESSIGSWPVERCLLEESTTMKFRKPKGGEADFAIPLDFESRRSANWWPEERADSVLGSKPAELKSCARSAATSNPRNVWVTLYLGNRGVVTSAGFASPHNRGIDAAWADCALEKIRAWTLSDPRGKIAKLGFRYNPE